MNSLKSELLKQSGLKCRNEYLKENKETDFKIKKMEVERKVNDMFFNMFDSLRTFKYIFKDYTPREDYEPQDMALYSKKLEELKKEAYKKVMEKYEELKGIIDDSFEVKETVEVEDDDYEQEGEEDGE